MVGAPVLTGGMTGGTTTKASQSAGKIQQRVIKNTETNTLAFQTANSINSASGNTAGRTVALQNQTGGNILGFTYE